MKKRAFITGITGQDGTYLAEFLLEKGYEVHGLVRRSSNNPFSRLPSLEQKITVHFGDLRDIGALERAIAKADPHEIYNLAAQSNVGVSFLVPEETYEINYAGVGRLVRAAMEHNKDIRIYQASTSEMFGATPPPQNEESGFAPVSPYAEAKLKAHQDYVEGYRTRHGLFICSGILFNHESPRRGEQFVTRKVTCALANIKLGRQEVLEIGNLEAKRDWGFAGDYVELMWKLLQQDEPEDFVIGTGETHTVRELINHAAETLDMPLVWSGEGENTIGTDAEGVVRVRVNKEYYRPREVHHLLADVTKARAKLGWEPAHTFKSLITLMAKADYEALAAQKPVA
ncbi:MAG: GDP-mannose 4,6-dehydratase [Candidatus Pacebacteria bacterium]|nr:GDP-mannose 4,6-dehydratase [Candidatus Paceibacterota bacterium]